MLVRKFLEKFFKDKNDNNINLTLSGVSVSFLSFLISEILKSSQGENLRFVLIFPEYDQAKEFLDGLYVFYEDKLEGTYLYPRLEEPPFKEIKTLSSEESEKMGLLWNLKKCNILSGDILSYIKKTVPLEILRKEYLYLALRERIERESFVKRLIDLGYERVGVVREKGEFTVKGGIIDLWSPNYPDPTRIELFGEEIVSIKLFNPGTQKSYALLEELEIIPCKEIFFPENIQPLYQKILSFRSMLSEPLITGLLNQVENRYISENPEYLLPIFYERMDPLFKNFSSDTVFVFYEPEVLEKKIREFWDKLYINFSKVREKREILFSPETIYMSPEEFIEFFRASQKLRVFEHSLINSDIKTEGLFIFNLSKDFKLDLESCLNDTGNRIEKAFKFLKKSIEDGKEVLMVVGNERTKEVVLEGLKHRGTDRLDHFTIKVGFLREGFYLRERNLLVTSELELFGKSSYKDKTYPDIQKSKGYLRKFEDLKPGDFVVHKLHGIGKYLGLKVLNIEGQEGEYLEIEYEGGDKLYLPVSRLEELYPYVGLTDKPPKLDRLGKKTFLEKKRKIEKELTEVVQELLSLYAERKALKGYSLSFPAIAYEEFRSTFPYEETQDQKEAIEEVIEDLCKDKLMERLVVGDVGFGKTEVALRATFLVAYHNKQVAFLVPTTILAEQHYRNFKHRLEPFGIKVGVLSRLRSEREQKETLKQLKEGEIKVIIGTHRLLSPDVEFKDLGLIVIDEEHRFGVKHKEKLKQLKKNVKVLSLSATPIPRSLQLSLLGIFDLSVIETPPSGRKPIKTFLAKFDPEIIKFAIERELERKGQVFFVNPRIQGLSSLARLINRLCPEARVEIIHGQMPGDLIERNLVKFLNKDIDVLVCTPIIGSGIDIPTANTIIINRADMFGLADIYQLRGRVGRSEEEAYAYLLVPSLKTISENAQKRLKALMKFTDLGSGFKLALSDLKIRGAGELLGIKQSGHINTVGYELYLELLENTIKTLKGEEVEEWDPEVNIKIPAYIPKSYVPDDEERLSLYRELILNKTERELLEFKEFLRDKYGELPTPVKNLIDLYLMKLYMRYLKIPLIEVKGKNLIIFIKKKDLLPRFRKFYRERSTFYLKDEKNGTKVIFKKVEDSLKFSLNLLKSLMLTS